MFKSFTHGERTVNVIISKGEDCGVVKKTIGELQDFVVNNAKQISKIGITAGLGLIFCGAAILIQNEQLKNWTSVYRNWKANRQRKKIRRTNRQGEGFGV